MSIPVERIIENLDRLFDKKEFDRAEKLLEYWVGEAEKENDIRGRLTMLNEQIGFYRKNNQKEKCLVAISNALELARNGDFDLTVTLATALINCATGYKAFGMPKEAYELYCEAKEIYEKTLAPDDARLGGLYNNMALAVAELGDYGGARELYNSALKVMRTVANGQSEEAITYCNLADLASAEKGMIEGESEINEYLEKAKSLLDSPDIPKDGYYAFVCEKCAPTFGYYGWFFAEKELIGRAEEIYERI